MSFTGFPDRALIFYEGLEADNSKPYWTDNRDVRFSRDKTPYKVNAAASVESYYLSLSAAGLFVAAGYWAPASDQVERLRRAVADDLQGPALERVLAGLRRAGFEVGGARLTRAPRGYPADHPRVELLKHKGLVGSRGFEPEPWLHTAAALDRVRDAWRALRPLVDWLDRNVGPSGRP